jgi:hypothetical protein
MCTGFVTLLFDVSSYLGIVHSVSFGLILWVLYKREELFREYRVVVVILILVLSFFVFANLLIFFSYFQLDQSLREFKYAITQLNIRPPIPPK